MQTLVRLNQRAELRIVYLTLQPLLTIAQLMETGGHMVAIMKGLLSIGTKVETQLTYIYGELP